MRPEIWIVGGKQANTILHNLWPARSGKRVLADWLAAMDIRDRWREVRSVLG